MERRRLRLLYVVGIALNAIALTAAWTAGELLFAGTFALVMVYLGLRYWMVATDRT
ncbi:hypothetical protein [Natrarchaeobaculum sulfurireducens]|nr:hypothetical protein [Natrarchaeobaculum sulfurireducens]AXR79549.1 hypothetical protein AArc1_3246 [Natrarchaeobaculum sulfurireducens]